MGLRDIPVAGTRRLYCLFRWYTWILVLSLRDTLIRAPYLPTGPPSEASFEAELLARTRHCQVFIFDHTASALPQGLSSHVTLPAGLYEFYAPLDALDNDGEFDFWDSRHTLQRAHFKPYRIAGFDAHGTGDAIQTYTLESLMRQNGVAFMRLEYLLALLISPFRT